MVRVPNDCERVNQQRLREITDLQRQLRVAQVRFEEMRDDRDNERTLRLATLENLKRERVARKQAQEEATDG